MSTNPRKNSKKATLIKFFKLINNSGFGEAMKNIRKQRYQVCKKPSKKNLFDTRIKQSCNKFFFQFISHRNENRKKQKNS